LSGIEADLKDLVTQNLELGEWVFSRGCDCQNYSHLATLRFAK
jgi:hypothetical protein